MSPLLSVPNRPGRGGPGELDRHDHRVAAVTPPVRQTVTEPEVCELAELFVAIWLTYFALLVAAVAVTFWLAVEVMLLPPVTVTVTL